MNFEELDVLPEKSTGNRLLTKEKRDLITQYVREGSTFRNASLLAGVPYAAVRQCLQRAMVTLRDKEIEDDEAIVLTPTERWYLEVHQARAIFVHNVIGQTVKAGATDPKAWAGAITVLERQDPDDWGVRQKIDVKQDTTLRIEVVRLPSVTKAIEGEVVGEGQFIEAEPLEDF